MLAGLEPTAAKSRGGSGTEHWLAWAKRFYESMLNDGIGVRMRRYLRGAKSPEAFKEMAEDRPRSNFWTVRSEIDVGRPDAILRFIQYGK